MRALVTAVQAQLSDVQELMLGRGLTVVHSMLWRWVQRYAPLLNQRLRGDLRQRNGFRRVDETYIRLGGRWVYLYRAVDSGMWIGILHMQLAFSELRQSGELGRRCRCRPCPYLNNFVEQDHRFIKKRIAAARWFRSVTGARNALQASRPCT